VVEGNPVETKLVKNAKWLARKWGTTRIVLHSFTHLGEQKADPEDAKRLIDRVQKRLETAGYTVVRPPTAISTTFPWMRLGIRWRGLQGVLAGLKMLSTANRSDPNMHPSTIRRLPPNTGHLLLWDGSIRGER